MDSSASTLSIIIPTFRREKLLVDTIEGLVPLMKEGDEILVVDQTPDHEAETEDALSRLGREGKIRWVRKTTPNQAEAMNVGALLATGEILLFLDDDIIPLPGLLEGHRGALTSSDAPPASCGQVLQPWHDESIDEVTDFDTGFDAAYSQPCEITSLMAGNYAIPKKTYFAIGGMDENFRGYNYRNDMEMSYRIWNRTGRKVAFVPDANLRHLLAGGGNRAFGHKDSWGNLGSSIGDYYFAMKWLPFARAGAHMARRFFRAPINRSTIRRPWKIFSLFLREIVALGKAIGRWMQRDSRYIRELESYTDVHVVGK